jgi:hypothetical protein
VDFGRLNFSSNAAVDATIYYYDAAHFSDLAGSSNQLQQALDAMEAGYVDYIKNHTNGCSN